MKPDELVEAMNEFPDIATVYFMLKKAEKLLMDLKTTGSHYQIKDKIDKYFKERND